MAQDLNVEPWVVRIRRNPNWFASLDTTARRVLFYAPSAWWWLVGQPLKAALAGLVTVPALTAFWLITTSSLVVLGVAGFVSDPEEDQPDG